MKKKEDGSMKRVLRPVLWLVLMLFLAAQVIPAVGEGASTRWADASDEIDKYLDTAFEDYLAGNTGTAYNNVNDAYFRVYETTGFERQTMSYISGVRKNAVEMQFSACKAAVKKENTDQETIVLRTPPVSPKMIFSAPSMAARSKAISR